jgi:uncharacterized membrane protein
MWILILGLVVFFAVHSVRLVAGDFRQAQISASERRWKGVYSLISAIGLAFIIWGWILFRPEAPQMFEPPAWGRHLAMALVWAAFVMLPAAHMPAGRIRHWVKHPMLLAVILWAVAHLLSNGDLASLLLFGSFLVYAVVDRVAVAGRGDPAPAIVRPRSDLISVVAGTVLYAIFVLWLHGWLFGVSPIG